ncbi:MAG: hypothetical protein OEQ75_16820 [Gemmatimonadota bacterium]|nr:hypothetical protein [Gemmatimonadota bacterium]
MHFTRFLIALASLTVAACLSCSRPRVAEETLFHNPVSDLTGVIAQDGVEFDAQTTSDGTGSLKINTAKPVTVRLYEVAGVDAEDAQLVYRAKIRTDGVQGQVYLEMWCRFPGKGEFFSRALHAPLTGSTEWTSQETSFLLEKGQNPDHIALNIVVNGSGAVWVDDVALVKAAR